MLQLVQSVEQREEEQEGQRADDEKLIDLEQVRDAVGKAGHFTLKRKLNY